MHFVNFMGIYLKNKSLIIILKYQFQNTVLLKFINLLLNTKLSFRLRFNDNSKKNENKNVCV
jgi:hypothetical protein